MTDITVDYKRGCYLVELSYGRDGTFLVDVVADPLHGTLIGDRPRYKSNGRRVFGEREYHLKFAAVREVVAQIKQQLSNERVRAVNLHERIEVAFIVTILVWMREQKVLPVLTAHHLRLAHIGGSRLSTAVMNTHMDARTTRNKVNREYVKYLKRNVLVSLWKEFEFTRSHRDFLSSVLGRAFSWESGYIPMETYREAARYRPGIMLAFQLADQPEAPAVEQ